MKLRKIAIGTTTVLVAAVSVAASGVLDASAIAPTVNTSTSANPNGWATQDGAPAYVTGPAGTDGNGSLRFSTPTNADKQNWFHAAGVPLSSVADLAYSVENSGGPQASFQLQVTGVTRLDNPSSTFTSLVYEPYQQPGHGSEVAGDGTWHTYSSLELGFWWSSHPIAGNPTGQSLPVKLSDIEAANPNATVTVYGVSQGKYNAGSVSYVDDVTFDNVMTNFEAAPQPTTLTLTPIVNIRTWQSINKLTATLMSGSTPVAGRLITFTAGGLGQCSAITNASGVAACAAAAGGSIVILNGGYHGAFAGDAFYGPSTGKASLFG